MQPPEIAVTPSVRARAWLLGGLILGMFAWYVHRYYFLGDDCFITFRYARNFVEGNGLVYNPGERVEGYTEFLWALFIAAGMKLGVRPELLANVLGIASGVLILASMVKLGGRTYGWGNPLVFLAPLCLAVNRTFCAWTTGGLATQFFALLIWLALLRLANERARGLRRTYVSALLFAAASLTRPEGALFFAAAGSLMCWDVFVRRRGTFSALVVSAASYGLIVGTHVLWRRHYYGYWVPNTFYAKVSGFWPEQAKVFFGAFFADYHVLWFLPLLLLLGRRGREGASTFVVPMVLYTSYVFYIGGDLFEFRFLTPILPALYWLFQEVLLELDARWVNLRPAIARTLIGTVAAMLVVCSWLPNRGGFEASHIAAVEDIAGYAERRTRQGKALRELIDAGYLSGTELVAVSGAGALPYYSRLPILDMVGLNDVTVAHQVLTQRGEIGHEKWASYEYLVQRKVVIIDLFNTMVFDERATAAEKEKLVAHVMAFRTKRLEEYPEAPVHALVAAGHYLVFGTTLSNEQFRLAFPRMRILF